MTARHPLVNSIRVMAAIVIAVATVLLGLAAAHHADAAAPHPLSSTIDVALSASGETPGGSTSDSVGSLTALEGCLVLLACCALGIIAARRVVQAVTTASFGVARGVPSDQLRPTASETKSRPSLIQLSISRT